MAYERVTGQNDREQVTGAREQGRTRAKANSVARREVRASRWGDSNPGRYSTLVAVISTCVRFLLLMSSIVVTRVGLPGGTSVVKLSLTSRTTGFPPLRGSVPCSGMARLLKTIPP